MIRRVILLYVLLPLGIVASRGQDNQNATEMDEIFQKGRKWIVMGEALVSPTVGRRVFSITGYECEGDNVVDGHLCNVLSCYSMYDIDNPFDVTEEALYSEGNTNPESKVYIYRDGCKYYWHFMQEWLQDKLLFDFSVNKGDKISLFDFHPQLSPLTDLWTTDDYPILVTEVGDTILEDSSDKRVRKWVRIYSEWDEEEDTWIEGIGSLKGGPIGSELGIAGAVHYLYKCFDDENIYYFNKNIPWYNELLSSIQLIENDNDTDMNRNDGVQETYTLQGIKTDTPSKGIRIIRYSDRTVKKVYTR